MHDNRSLSPEQLEAVRAVLPALSRRDRLLWLLSYHCAYRIHETLSIRIADVWHDGAVRPFLTIARRHLKGGGESCRHRRRVSSRTVPIHPVAAAAIRDLVMERIQGGPLDPESALFQSQKGGPIKSVQAWRIFQRIYRRAGLSGPGLGTHLTRRTAARILYERSQHDIELVRAALNHRSIVSTQHYIRMSECEAVKAFLEL